MSSSPGNQLSGRVRPRACGLIVSGQRLLLVKIDSPTREEPFWLPPGGGISFRETAAETAAREVKEETGLVVHPRKMVFVSEYIHNKWHALEFYFQCDVISGDVSLGSDPEFGAQDQMLTDIGWFGADELNRDDVFPVFIREYRHELLASADMPLRYVTQ